MVVGMALALLKQRGILTVFWEELVVMTVYILNRSPTKTLNGRTSYKAWHGRKLAVSLVVSCLLWSLDTAASSTTEALRGCSSATRRARRPTTFLTQGHSVCT
jgi:hypothetical protein